MEADIDFIIRSRTTILEILEDRGYNVDSYKGVSPEDLHKLVTTSAGLLTIIAAKRPDGPAPKERAIVLYWVESAYRLRLETEIMKLWDVEEPEHYNITSDELIVIINEPFHEVFHLQSIKQWNTKKACISFFQVKNLISNPSKHTFVPPHRKLIAPEVEEVIKTLHLNSKNELPHIKYHVDMQARVLGLVPGDIVEIQRPSETCGLYTLYRVCTA
jgi:DNA-directed RNA polymerase subunit H (RpoH/RPB5)